MKFFCDNCNAQYMIADEKVGTRGVKVKCKKCAHVILVKPASDAAGATSSEFGADKTLVGVSLPSQPAHEKAEAELSGAFDSLLSESSAQPAQETGPAGASLPAVSDDGASKREPRSSRAKKFGTWRSTTVR